MKRNKAFTLIELVSVLVILAILALIVTPLVLNIIRKARIAADKRSIDAYGKSIELAIADYLLENGTFPTSIEDLQAEYSGDTVTCGTTQLNTDLTVYLAECTVGNRAVEEYTYGTNKIDREETINPAYEAYELGTIIQYKGESFYVIEDSNSTKSTVILLKTEPLTVEEVNMYGEGYVNRYTPGSKGTAYDLNGYGGIAYYSSLTCDGASATSGCIASYNQSDIKYVVEGWADAKFGTSGYEEARLITKEEYESTCKEEVRIGVSDEYTVLVPQYDWIHGTNYTYWTMSMLEDSNYNVWVMTGSGLSTSYEYNYRFNVVRPVIVLSKSALN